MGSNKVKITVEFDKEAWESLSDEARDAWLDEVVENISVDGYVSAIEIEED